MNRVLVNERTNDLMRRGAYEKYAISAHAGGEPIINKAEFRQELFSMLCNFSDVAADVVDTDSIGDDISKLATDTLGATKAGLSTAGNAIANGASNVAAGSINIANATADQLQEVWQDVKQGTGDGLQAAKQFLTATGAKTQEELTEAYNFLKSQGAVAGEELSKFFTGLGVKIGDAAQATGSGLSRAAQATGDFVNKNATELAIGGGAGAAGAAAALVGNKLKQKQNAKATNFSNVVPQSNPTVQQPTVNFSTKNWIEGLGGSIDSLPTMKQVSTENFSDKSSSWLSGLGYTK